MGNCQQVSQKDDSSNLMLHSTPKGSNSKKYQDQQKELEEETKQSDSKINYGDIPNFMSNNQPALRKPAPQWTAVGYFQGIKTFSLSDYSDKYLILFFFPFDFSSICHQEIIQFSDSYEKFENLHTQVIGCSVDSQYVHQNYCQKPRSEGGLGGINIPLISDVNREISRKYGVMIEDGEGKGASFRSVFIIDRKQILRHTAINDLDTPFDIHEILRILKAIQQADNKGTNINYPSNKGVPKQNTNTSQGNSNYQAQQQQQQTGNISSNRLSAANIPQNNEQQSGPAVLNLSRRASNAGVGQIQGMQQMQGAQRASISKGGLPTRQFTSQNSGAQGLEFDPSRAQKGRKRSILKKRTLFDRMGGEHQIRQFVKKLFTYILEDTRINFFWKHIQMEKHNEQFSNYIIQIFEGPSDAYKGKDLVIVHKHLAVNGDQFEAFCQILEGTLVEFGQDDETIREVFILIDPMKDYLVNYDTARPLVERIGGEHILDNVLEKEFQVLKKDTDLPREVQDFDLNKLKQIQTEFFKVALSSKGYSGKNMRDLHKQLHVNSRNFDKILKTLEDVMFEMKIEGGAAQEILILFEPNLQYKHLPKGKAPLYNRIGGSSPEKLFQKIFKIAFNNILKDNRIKQYFQNVDISHLQNQTNCFVTLYFGGPINYSGKTLRDAHWHLELKDEEFEAFKECIYKAMREMQISQDLIDEADEQIEPLRTDIVSVVPSLVERCGGEQVVHRVVDYFYDLAVNDKRIKHFFPKQVDMQSLRDHNKDYMIALLGGINKYTGRSMADAHNDLNLDDVHFNVVKDLLIEGFKKDKVPLSIISEVSRVLETQRHLMVNRHSTLFEKLGGDQALFHVINHLYSQCQTDNQLRGVFKNVVIEKLKPKMQNYLTYLLGGPITYEGKSLRDAHKLLRISDDQFTIFATHLQQGFLSVGTIDTQTIQDICQIVEAMRGEVIKRPATLYERLGGENAIPLCIQVFIKKLQNDKMIGQFFVKVDMVKHGARLTEFFTMLTGGLGKDGDIAYKGGSLKQAHSGLVLSGSLFDRFNALLKETMEQMGAEDNEQNEVIDLLESLRTEVIGNKQPTVLDRMGGDRELTAIVNTFFDKVEDHQTLASYFRKSNMTTLRTKFLDFLTSTIGGTNTYEGKGLKEAHWRLNLSNTQFNQFTELFKASLVDNKVEGVILKETIQFWETLRGQIVQRKDEFDESDSGSQEEEDDEDEEEEDEDEDE